MGKSKASKANDEQQQMLMQDCSGDGAVETGYRYDPNRGRRTTAYSAKEMQRLSAAHRARLKRNRELAKASKERKKQRLMELQQNTAELEATMPQLRAELAAKQAALQQARAQTVSLLEACSCDACKHLQGQLQQLGSS
jgi:chromosome segregation ATPase